MILPIFIFLFGLAIPDSKRFEISIDAGIKLPGNEKWMKRLKLSDEQIKIADSLVNLYVKEN